MARWFVDNENGNDANNGQTPQTAFYTIAKAISMCSGQPPGDEIIIRPGVYDERLLFPKSYTSFIGDISGEYFGITGWVYMQNVSKTSNSQDVYIFSDNAGNNAPLKNLTFKNLFFIMMGAVLSAPFRFWGRITNLRLENCIIISHMGMIGEFTGGENSSFKNCYGINLMDRFNLKYENCYITGDIRLYTYPYGNLHIRNSILPSAYSFRRSDGGDGGSPDSFLMENSSINKVVFLDDPAVRTYNYDYGVALNSQFMVYYGGNQTNSKMRLVNCIDILGLNFANWTRINPIVGGKGTISYVYVNRKNSTQFREAQVVYPTGMKDASNFSYYNWSYYKPVIISNPNNYDLTDFQVMFKLDTASLITAGKMRPFCQDLRVFLDTGEGVGQELPFWIEGPENDANTIIWTKIPSIPANGSVTLRVYYGNSVMPRKSDGINTFEFFDDFVFNTANKYKWHVLTADNTYSDAWTTNAVPDYIWPGNLKLNSVPYQTCVSRWDKFSRPLIIETKVKATGALQYYACALGYWVKNGYPNHNYAAYRSCTDGTLAKLWYCDANGRITIYEGTNVNLALDTYYIHRLQLTSTSVRGVWLNSDRTYRGEVWLSNTDWNNCYIILDHYITGTAGYWAYFDWILVRKYADNNPTYSVGDEVSGTFQLYEPPTKDMYGRVPIGTRDIGPIESEYGFPTFVKIAVSPDIEGGFSK